MLEVEKSLFDAHKHTENVDNTLGKVADYMKAETAFFTKVKNGIIDEYTVGQIKRILILMRLKTDL